MAVNGRMILKEAPLPEDIIQRNVHPLDSFIWDMELKNP